MKSPVRFDDSLPVFAKLIKDAWGDSALQENLFLRDASGKLTFVILRDAHSTEERARVASGASREFPDKTGVHTSLSDTVIVFSPATSGLTV